MKRAADIAADEGITKAPAGGGIAIRQLTIERFRGIRSLKWNPAAGLNVVIGGGDVGKSTILDAIALLLNPSNAAVISESDYHWRDTSSGFCIQAVLSLPPSTEIGHQRKFIWPWEWNGHDAVVPLTLEGGHENPATSGSPVYRFQVRGTPDMELVWEIVQPNEEVENLSSSLRRALGVVRLGSDDRSDRDLRLVYGSALDRLLTDQGLRARIGKQISDIPLDNELSEEAKGALQRLDDELRAASLPYGLELGLTSAQGLSIGALIGLHARTHPPTNADGKALPLASWGAGTRRMVTLQIAAATQASARITVIDEVERGLEPYRVRRLVESLLSESTQVFITTHSAIAMSAATRGHLWYVDSTGRIGQLPRTKIERQQERDPETFLARLAVVAEGATEVGFISYFLEKAVSGNLQDLGIRVCDGQGTPAVLDLLEAMSSGGLTFAGFVDGTTEDSGRWMALKERMGDLLFRWMDTSTEAAVISLVEEKDLIELLRDGQGQYDIDRLNTLAERLSLAEASIDGIVKAAGQDLRGIIVAAASGDSGSALDPTRRKAWKKHGRQWFKSAEGGRELAEKVERLGLWPKISVLLLPFLNAIREFAGQEGSSVL